ncbi:MAG: HNH endonuclease, partial [Proteobacteria bacterium]|nr:HNH endonuclease [Pseudomonadota bacterium]
RPQDTRGTLQRRPQDTRDISDGDFKILDPEELQYVEGADRLRRNTLFRKVVLGKYEGRCAVSGLGLATPLKRDGEGRPLPQRYEVEGAHIVPVSRGGPDHIRNGLPLCQTLHWAFDEGMFGVDEDRKIYLPDDVKSDKKNEFIRQYEGKEIAEATDPKYSADNVAFEWHTANVVEKWCPK